MWSSLPIIESWANLASALGGEQLGTLHHRLCCSIRIEYNAFHLHWHDWTLHKYCIFSMHLLVICVLHMHMPASQLACRATVQYIWLASPTQAIICCAVCYLICVWLRTNTPVTFFYS